MLKPRVLQNLISIHKMNIDSLILAKKKQEVELIECENGIKKLMSDLESEKSVLMANPDLSFAFAGYYSGIKQKISALVYKLAEEKIKLDGIIDDLISENTELEKYSEILAKQEKDMMLKTRVREEKAREELTVMRNAMGRDENF